MLMRPTTEAGLRVVACEANTAFAPDAVCSVMTGTFAALAGL